MDVLVIHEDEKNIRREVLVTGVPNGTPRAEVEAQVNCLVLPLCATLEFTWDEIR